MNEDYFTFIKEMFEKRKMVFQQIFESSINNQSHWAKGKINWIKKIKKTNYARGIPK